MLVDTFNLYIKLLVKEIMHTVTTVFPYSVSNAVVMKERQRRLVLFLGLRHTAVVAKLGFFYKFRCQGSSGVETFGICVVFFFYFLFVFGGLEE